MQIAAARAVFVCRPCRFWPWLAGSLALLGLAALLWPSEDKPRRAAGGISFTERDRDLMIRTLWAESAHEPRLGQIGVAWVMRNRLARNPYGWKSLAQVVTACGHVRRGKRRVKICQFEPWLHADVVARMKALSPSSPAYMQLAGVVDDVLSGRAADPTHGAWYFLNLKTVRARVKKGMKMPAFARGGRCKTVIGRHSFCPPLPSVMKAVK